MMSHRRHEIWRFSSFLLVRYVIVASRPRRRRALLLSFRDWSCWSICDVTITGGLARLLSTVRACPPRQLPWISFNNRNLFAQVYEPTICNFNLAARKGSVGASRSFYTSSFVSRKEELHPKLFVESQSNLASIRPRLILILYFRVFFIESSHWLSFRSEFAP